MSIYSQRSFDLLNKSLSETFNTTYVEILLSDEDRTFLPHTHLSCPGPFAGQSHSEETKRLISKRLKGKKQPNKKTNRKSSDFTEDWKQKISKAKSGVPSNQKWTPEEREFAKHKALNQKFGDVCKGRIWINDGAKNLRINPEHISMYPGFVRGRLV